MNASEMKTHLQAFSRTLDYKKKDEWWGTMRQVWQDFYPKFLMWYTKVKAKEHQTKKTLDLVITVEEADTLIRLLDNSLKGENRLNHQEIEARRELIGRMQQHHLI